VFMNHVQHGCIHLLRCRGPVEHVGRVIPPLLAQGCEQAGSVCNGQSRPKKCASLHHTSSSATDNNKNNNLPTMGSEPISSVSIESPSEEAVRIVPFFRHIQIKAAQPALFGFARGT